MRDVLNQFENADITDGFTDLEIADIEHGTEKREIDIDGLPVEAFEGMFSPDEIKNMRISNNPFDEVDETDLDEFEAMDEVDEIETYPPAFDTVI